MAWSSASRRSLFCWRALVSQSFGWPVPGDAPQPRDIDAGAVATDLVEKLSILRIALRHGLGPFLDGQQLPERAHLRQSGEFLRRVGGG
jgi:hypothetical protein